MPSAIKVRRINAQPPKTQKWSVQGWKGMYDSRAKKAERPDEAPILINWRITDPDRGGALQLRAGMQRVVTPNTTQLASAASWQALGAMFFTASQTLVVVSGGEIYTLDPSTWTLTKQVTTANLTTAGITLGTGKVYITQFGLVCVITEDQSIHRPFTWNGVAGAGGLVNLTNAPANITGPPAVYYAKLFFIKTGLHTIVWSEENQANTGYEAGGFNNAWDLTQTSATLPKRLLGTNEGLYYWRTGSAGVIRGAVSSTFQTDGVHDSVSQEGGTSQIVDPIWAGNAVWWVSGDFHPMVYRPDIGAIDLADQLPREFGAGAVQGPTGSPDRSYLGSVGEELIGNAWNGTTICQDKSSQQVHFEVFTGGSRRVVFIFDALRLKLLATDLYPNANLPNNARRWAEIILPFAGGSPQDTVKLYCDTNGFIFRQPIADADTGNATGFDETNGGAGAAVPGTLIGPMHGHSADIEWQFLQLDLLADALPNNNISIGYITSRFHKAALSPADQTLVDAVGANTPYERHKSFGLSTSGRWCRPVIVISGEATQNRLPQLHGYTLRGVPMSDAATVT